MRVLVTGGAGFIGSNLCKFLMSSGGIGSVIALDDLSTGSEDNLRGVDVELVRGSILDPECLTRVALKVDAIVHLAARPSVPRSIADPRPSHDANATGTLNVLEAAREAGARVIVASSSSVYGANPQLPKVESMTARPMSPYAASKLATESYALAWAYSYGLGVLAFRFFNVYGPLQAAGHSYAAVIPAFIDATLRNQPLKVNGDGSQSRDFTYVDSVCGVIWDALVRGVTHDTPVNLALGTRTSINELIDVIGEVGGKQVKVEYHGARVGDVLHSSADPTLLRSLFPNVEAVPLAVGVRTTYEWMASANENRPERT